MRILVVTSTFPRWQGDAGPVFVYELCRRLHGLGVDLDVLAPHASGAKTFESMDGINVFRYRYCLEKMQILAYGGGMLANLKRHWYGILLVPFFMLFQGIAICNRLRREKYDLVHAHWIIPQGFMCVLANILRGRRNRKTVVCTSHGGDLHALRGRLFRAIRRFVMDRIACLCVVSRAMQQVCIADGLNPDHISVLPMGVDLKHVFTPAAASARNDRRLIFAGRLVEKKGIDYLIDAVAVIKKTMPDIELLLVGDGPEISVIRQKIKQLGLEQNVTLTGSLENAELPALYASAAVAVNPSLQEGFGLVTVEAMGCGCAVVASDLPALHDIVKHQHNGLLARPGDAADLAEKIMLLLKDKELRNQLAANGRADVSKRFDWDEAAAQYHKLFKELLS